MEFVVGKCFSKQNLSYEYMRGRVYIGCNFYNCDLNETNFSDSLFIDCSFYRAEYANANFRACMFLRSREYEKTEELKKLLRENFIVVSKQESMKM